VPWIYNIPLHIVYTGTSTQVYAMAIDWLSGSIYWSDALYNWITVARLEAYDIFNHIVTTELDRPMGIAVYPQNGYEFPVASQGGGWVADCPDDTIQGVTT